MRELTFQEIFEANVSELIELSHLHEGKTSLSFYIDIVLNFMQGETQKLERINDKFSQEKDLPFHLEISKITEARLNIRRREITEKNLLLLEKQIADFDPLWVGETYFILALSFGKLKKHVKAKILFKKAYKHFHNIGCNRKSLLSFQNFITAESNADPEKNMVSEYLYLSQKAEKENFPDIQAHSLLNLSREYQKRNGFHLALKYIDSAIEISSAELAGLLYWLILSQKADLLIEMDRKHEAILILEELSASEFSEIKQNINMLKEKINPSSSSDVNPDEMTHHWAQRAEEDEKRTQVQLGDLEQKLVDFISDGPKEKYDIIEHIYGSSGDLYSLENRFKRLLGRTRKKLPNLIVYKDGKYVISDAVFLHGYKKAT